MLFSRALLASSLALLASAQSATITSLTPAQESKVVKDIESYLSGIVTQPAYTSNALIVATALPDSVIEEYQDNPSALFSQIATSTPDWFKDLPTNVQSYYNSIAQVEASIINKDVKGPAPTVGPKAKVVAAVGMVAGAVAVAL